MSRIRLLTSTYTRPTLAMLAVLLLLSGLAFPGTARAQDEPSNIACFRPGLELPAELAELDVEGLQIALQELVEADPEATVTLSDFVSGPARGRALGTVRADLLLADEAVLVALLGDQPVPLKLTLEFPAGVERSVISAIEVATAEDCTFPGTGAGDDTQDDMSEKVTVTFELTVTGEPPADALFFGIFGEGFITVPLLDRDGDGVYTFQGINVTEGEQVTGRIIQATGETEEGEPGEPITVIEEFGPLTITESQVLEASVSFDDDQQGGDEQVPDNQQDDAQDDQQAETPEEMPETGAGGTTAGTTIPLGNAATGLVMLAGAGYAVLRRR